MLFSSFTGKAVPFIGVEGEKGGIVMLRGNYAADYIDGLAGVLGTPGMSLDFNLTKLYYSGSVKSMNLSTFTGTYYSLSLGADFGLSIGVNASYSPIAGTPNFVIGFGANVGIGFNVYLLDLNFKIGRSSTEGNPFH